MAIETDMERMYRAGKQDIPNAADRLSGIAARLYDHLGTFDAEAALAGDPVLMRSMLQVGGEIYAVIRGAVDDLNDCAGAVIKTADDFRRTDEQARNDYQHLDPSLRDMPIAAAPAPPDLPHPEKPGAVIPTDHGSTTWDSTPAPDAPDKDAHQREANETASEERHDREERGR